MGKLKNNANIESILTRNIIYRCIFVWRVPHDMVVTMHARLSQQAMRQGKTLDNEIFTDGQNVDFHDSNPDSDYRFV